MVHFPARIPDWDHSLESQSCSFGFLSSDASICSTVAFPPLGNSDRVVVSVSIDFPTNSQHDALFHCIAYNYSPAYWDGCHDYLRDVPWKDIFKLGEQKISGQASGLHGFQLLVLLPQFMEITFFCLYQREKYSDSKANFGQASCKRVLEAVKLAYVNKAKESITSQKLGSHDYC